MESLKTFYTNADSLLNKLDELQVYIDQQNFDVVFITELFPKNRLGIDLSLVEYAVKGYTLYAADPAGYQGRGVGIYIKDEINSVFLNSTSNRGVESVNLLLQSNNGWLMTQCIYRSPSSGNESILELKTVMEYKPDNYNITQRIIVGDFNIKDIDWELEMSTGGEQHIATKFMELIRDNYLFQHIKEPTREREGTTPSTLDLLFTNENNMIQKIDINPPLGNSDHMVLIFDVTLYIENNAETREKFLFFKGDYKSLSEELSNFNWNILTDLSAIEAWDVFAETIINESRNHIPVSRTRPKTYKTPWMNKEALAAVKEKRRRWKKCKYNRNAVTLANYTEAKRKASYAVREAKGIYERQVANNIKTDPKSFWRYVQSKTKTKDKIEAISDNTGNLQHLDSIKVTLLNNYFTSVFTKENLETLPNIEDKPSESYLESVIIDSEKVRKYLSTLNPTKSSGPDNMHPKLFKELSDIIAEPLSEVFRKSIEEGVLPQCWKNANITAIFKKGDKSSASNYRPISLTSILVKILEKIIREAIVDHMNTNNFFSRHQHGFRSGLSCVTQLLETIDDWTRILDEKKGIDVIYFDFQKAFDTVPHQRLLAKLHSYGIRGNILKWIKDFLGNRKQRVLLKAGPL